VQRVRCLPGGDQSYRDDLLPKSVPPHPPGRPRKECPGEKEERLLIIIILIFLRKRDTTCRGRGRKEERKRERECLSESRGEKSAEESVGKMQRVSRKRVVSAQE